MAAPKGPRPIPKKQVDVSRSGTGGGPGRKKPTAVGTGDDGQEDWLSPIAFITSLTGEAANELEQFLSAIAKRPGVIATMLVGRDASLIASMVPPDVDAE